MKYFPNKTLSYKSWNVCVYIFRITVYNFAALENANDVIEQAMITITLLQCKSEVVKFAVR